jgi:hypothetical protein
MARMTVDRVKGVEGGALGAVVFVGRQQRLQLVAEDLPAGVLVRASHRIGEDRQSHRPESAEAGEDAPLALGGGAVIVLEGFQSADGGDDVSGLGLLAGGQGQGRCPGLALARRFLGSGSNRLAGRMKRWWCVEVQQ